MHRGHQTTLDAELVMNHLGQRRQAIGGAAGVADDGLAGVGFVVHAKDKHRGVVFGRCRQDDFFGASVKVLLGGDLIQEQAGGLDHDVSADFVPFQVGRIALLRQADFLAVDHQRVAVNRDVALEAAMHAVVLQHVGQVAGFQQVVDADHFNVTEILQGRAQHVAADTAKAVDTNFDRHTFLQKKIKFEN